MHTTNVSELRRSVVLKFVLVRTGRSMKALSLSFFFLQRQHFPSASTSVKLKQVLFRSLQVTLQGNCTGGVRSKKTQFVLPLQGYLNLLEQIFSPFFLGQA